jgi:hypothetical protein
MKMTLLICLTFALAGALAFAHTSSSQDAKPSSSSVTTKASSPFACNRFALTSAERTRHFQELGPKLRDLRKSVRELDNGYEFEFPSDPATYALLTEWMIQERACCPFFDIALRLDREGGPLWLRLSGRPGTKDFIKVDGADWVKQ